MTGTPAGQGVGMGLEIIINVAREETRVAVLDRKVLTDLYIDRVKHRDYVGNVYKGKVVKVLPGLQAAFIDIGQDKAAFMHVSELTGGIGADETLLELDDKAAEVPKPKRHASKPIEQLLEEGQELVVQVVKGPIGTKGSRVTSYVSLPGRYLVFLPHVDHIGISRRIENDEERARLKQLMLKLRKPGSGYIVRTVSEGVTDDELRSDVEFLQATWEEIQEKKTRLKAPALLHNDLDLVFRTVRDHFTKEIAYQLKLRSIGGIISIDFIDMERERNREKVFQALNDALAHDKARTRILRISELGLVEMSRERVREDLYRALSEPCHYCEGRAYTKDPTTICYELFRDIRRLSPTPDERTIVIGAHPNVASLLADEEADSLAEIERERQVKVLVKPDPTLHIEQYDIVML